MVTEADHSFLLGDTGIELWARKLKPTFQGDTVIGYMIVIVAVVPITNVPIWAVGFAPSREDAWMMAYKNVMQQAFPYFITGAIN